MTDSFAARFAAARDRHGPLAIGADPHGQVLGKWGLTDDADGLERFTDIVLSAAVGTAGLIKPQSAFYERHGWRGIRALARLAETARAEGLLVILDVKRGDVGSTNGAYAAAYLGDGAPIQADAITVHPYLGLAAMDEFVHRAHQSGACLLVVTRSSNPEGRAVQSARAAPGMTVDQRLLADIATLNARLAPGRIGPVGRDRARPDGAPTRPGRCERTVPRSRRRRPGRHPRRRRGNILGLPRPRHPVRLQVPALGRSRHRRSARRGRPPQRRVPRPARAGTRRAGRPCR
jgi:orotidine-5'-phosphate decarboxylase